MLRKTILGLFMILTLLMSVPLQAADFPTKEVQIIIPGQPEEQQISFFGPWLRRLENTLERQ